MHLKKPKNVFFALAHYYLSIAMQVGIILNRELTSIFSGDSNCWIISGCQMVQNSNGRLSLKTYHLNTGQEWTVFEWCHSYTSSLLTIKCYGSTIWVPYNKMSSIQKNPVFRVQCLDNYCILIKRCVTLQCRIFPRNNAN